MTAKSDGCFAPETIDQLLLKSGLSMRAAKEATDAAAPLSTLPPEYSPRPNNDQPHLRPALRPLSAPPLRPQADAGDLFSMGKPCPQCGHLVVKTIGCDHIECTCGAHWCYRCGELQRNENACYDHMYNCEGGQRSAADERRITEFRK